MKARQKLITPRQKLIPPRGPGGMAMAGPTFELGRIFLF